MQMLNICIARTCVVSSYMNMCDTDSYLDYRKVNTMQVLSW